MRRTTLGPISSSQLNARQGLLHGAGGGAASRMSLAPQMTKSTGGHRPMRQSIGPAVPTTSSAFGGGALRNSKAAPRASMANGSNASANSMLPPPHARNSLMRQSTGRRSMTASTSIGAGAAGGSAGSGTSRLIRNDPRPVSDKAFMNGCIQSVLEYLSSHQYPHPLSPKLLRGPSKKEFLAIVLFLFRQMDANFEFGSSVNGVNPGANGARNANAKIEDEIVNKFRTLGYPIAISKTALVAVGSPHSWPALLAALTWIVEYLRYDEKVQEAAESNSTMEFFEYVQHSYHTFLAFDEAEHNRLVQQMLEQKHARRQEAVEVVTEAKARHEELRRLIEEAKTAKSSLPALHSKKTDCVSDLEKFQTLCKQLSAHQALRIKKAQQYEEELRRKESLLMERTNEIKRLHVRIEQQNLSADDVERIQLECRRLKEQHESVYQAHKELEGRLWSKDTGIVRLAEQLEEIVKEYSGMAARLKLIPSTAKYANGMNYEIHLDAVAGGPEAAIGFSNFVHKTLAPALVELRKSRQQRKETALDESDKLGSTILTSNERLRREQEFSHEKETQLRKVDETLARERLMAESNTRQREQAIEEIELKIQSTYNAFDCESSLRQSELTKRAAQTKLIQLRERYQDMVETNRHLFTDALSTFTQHKAAIETLLMDMETTLKQTSM